MPGPSPTSSGHLPGDPNNLPVGTDLGFYCLEDAAAGGDQGLEGGARGAVGDERAFRCGSVVALHQSGATSSMKPVIGGSPET